MARPDNMTAAANWRVAANYASLLHSDRRGFAWEWLRRNTEYLDAWDRQISPPSRFGLVAYADPDQPVAAARPIWTPETDPAVLDSRLAGGPGCPEDLIDIRALADFVSVEIDEANTEHWLLSNGQWVVRLDLHDGTLLGGPALLQHHLLGLRSSEPAVHTLRQLIALANQGRMPRTLQPREVRAERWILELRAADGIAAGASQQDMARTFFGQSVSKERWRVENASYRLRIQRLVRAARRNLCAPLNGPWFS